MSESAVVAAPVGTESNVGNNSPSAPWRAVLKGWPWVAAVLSGILLAGAYPPLDRGVLIWIALTPLVAAVWISRSKRPFLLGYVAGVVFFTATFHWLGVLGRLFELPVLYGLPLLLALYLALYPALWCWFLARILVPSPSQRLFPHSFRNLATGAAAASTWTILEWVRGWLLGGFGWNGLGVALHRDLPTMQIVEITGVAGLTWLVAFVNVMAVVVIRRIAAELGPVFLKRIRWEFTTTVALVVLVFAYGVRALVSLSSGEGKPIRIAAVQPNIPQTEKFDAASEDDVFRQLERLTLPLAGFQPDLVLWPESATPRGLFADETNFDFVQRVAGELGAPLLLGTVTYEGERSFNSAVLVSAPEGKLALHGAYSKIRLVPFGEYLPLRPILNPIAGGLVPGDFDPGDEFTVFTGRKGERFATLICFEDTAGDLTRRFVSDGAEALINITNDGWFMRTSGAEQHFANSVFRAVENRRPLVRCCNTGVTALVHPSGQVDRWIQPHTQGGAIKPVNFVGAPITFYTRHGDWIIWASFLPVAVAIIRRVRARGAA